MKVFETHTHFEDEAFKEDMEETIDKARKAGVATFMNVGSTLDSCRKSVELAERYDDFYAAVGIHPEYGQELDDAAYAEIKKMAESEKVPAIGEIGLDYYWDSCPKDIQRAAFLRQLELAKELDKAIIIHSRDAAEDTLEIIKKFAAEMKAEGKPLRLVMHCYGYSAEMAKIYTDMGCYIGVGGVVTFKNARKLVETVEQTDISKIVVETDSPYMSPVPKRGKRNDSSKLVYIVEKIAEIKGISPEEVAEKTYENACRLYFGGTIR